MRKSVPNSKKNKTWSVALKTFDWTKVAFKHFTPEECDAKWKEIMQKLRKIKTLNELIVDAQNAVNDAKMELPKKPLSANALFFAENKERFKKRNPGVKSREMMKFVNDTFKKLPSEKKVGLNINTFFIHVCMCP
uniref:HMG box domain-containing protein n=1 Tax=Periophthalmus magnuspinnatus TaxID=409849 RepID=A0A3B4B2A8_9GOBI